MRIASLIPSGTDIAASLGLAEALVGISHACDHPAALDLPVLTSSLIPFSLDAAAIDRQVSEAVQNGDGSLYRTNCALLRELQPDVVLTQSICDVCAVNSQSAARDLPPGAQLINLGATDLAGLWRDLRAVATVTGTNAELLITSLQARLEAVRHAVVGRSQPSVLVLEWTEPPFLGGHWVPEIIERAGGTHLLGATGTPSRRATWEEITACDPDVIVLAPCGYNLEETATLGRELWQHDEFLNLRAVREGNVWATNATHLFSRCTPQSVRAVEVMAGVLHPDVWPGAGEARLLNG